MAIPLYLAMTAAEFGGAAGLPAHPAWMACHFSPYGTGLTNLPRQLPNGALLILNDRTPIHGHDPARIASTLTEVMQTWGCSGLLMDFQRPGCSEAADIAAALAELPFPTAVSDLYAQKLDCPVFLSAPPLRKPLREHLAPWQGREIWLEAALGGECATVTEKGCSFAPLPAGETPECPQTDEPLHCRYRIDAAPGRIQFILRRTRENLDTLLAEAASLGVTQAVGLYQELGQTEPR